MTLSISAKFPAYAELMDKTENGDSHMDNRRFRLLVGQVDT